MRILFAKALILFSFLAAFPNRAECEDHEGKITKIIAISSADSDNTQRGDIRIYLNDASSFWVTRAADLYQKTILSIALSAQSTGSTVHFETTGPIGTSITRLWILSN